MFLHDRNNHRETLIAVTWPSTMASILLFSPEDAASAGSLHTQSPHARAPGSRQILRGSGKHRMKIEGEHTWGSTALHVSWPI